jgi:hypothetical protein
MRKRCAPAGRVAGERAAAEDRAAAFAALRSVVRYFAGMRMYVHRPVIIARIMISC